MNLYRFFTKNKIIFYIVILIILTFSTVIALEGFYFIKEKKQLKNASLINFYELIDKIKEREVNNVHYIHKNNNNFFFKEHYLIYAQGYEQQKYYCFITASLYNTLLFNLNNYKIFLQSITSNTKYNFLELYIRLIFFLSTLIFMCWILVNLSNFFFNSKRNLSQKLYQNKNTITFADIAGLEQEKKELFELVDILKNPQKYKQNGIQTPKGVLLEGPPGTGKTLLAKALANEINIPFYFFSGSEFVEVYIGVGAARIRNIFQEIKKNSSCILFIDEIDALGGKREKFLNSSGNQEKNHTLNQFLVEMDGFERLNQVIVIGATNRIDMLDPALLRPGRFDRIIKIKLPDLKARKAILQVHARNKKIAADIDWQKMAYQTQGTNGAQLAAILNEASILAMRNQRTKIDFKILEKALERVLLGVSQNKRLYTSEEKKIIAYHEAGRAVISSKLLLAPKISEITVNMQTIKKKYHPLFFFQAKTINSLQKMLALVTFYLAGRAAEELIFNDISDLFDDFNHAQTIAKSIVKKYEINDIMTNQEPIFSNYNLTNQEVKKIITNCFFEAKTIIQKNQTLLKEISQALLKKETIKISDR
ncbi:AAA family ATPase [Candidatus Phytoplasma solani]|uniref:AAA family ATPase n=1 Tax=Candidatus Phytoplasma solani TaxID=69896 RepID=UPI00358E2792